MDSQSYILCLCLFLAFCLYYRFTSSAVPLPPGPRRYPLIGSALSFPRGQHEWLTFSRWGKEYGHISYFSILGRDFVVLNSAKSINDLLYQNGINFSERPSVQMVGPLTGYDRITAFSPYNERLRLSRKLLQPTLAGRSVAKWHPYMEGASLLLMMELLNNPRDLHAPMLLYAARLVLKVAYGYDVTGPDDALVAIAENCITQIGQTFEIGRFLVESIPILRYVPSWFPGADWKRTAAHYKACVEEMVSVPYNIVKERMKDGRDDISFTSDAIRHSSEYGEDLIMWSAHALYAGGTDTSVAGVETFFMAMTMYPSVQQKAQREIDALVGSSRLPCGADRSSLPYVNAVLKEILRMFPVAPLALPHAAADDFVYEGFLIPKGATIFGNSWSMLHDPQIYPDPFEFKPERFLGSHPQPDPKDYGAFGHGRRRCPAVDFAEESMFILFALTLSTFDIVPTTDNDGKKIVPKGEFSHRIIPHPTNYQCNILPRSKAAIDAIKLACVSQTVYSLNQ